MDAIATLKSRGYKMVLREGKDYPEHWEVYEKVFGKHHCKWHIHHIDRNKHNNASMNLIALPPQIHEQAHKGKVVDRQELEQQVFLWKFLSSNQSEFKELREKVTGVQTRFVTNNYGTEKLEWARALKKPPVKKVSLTKQKRQLKKERDRARQAEVAKIMDNDYKLEHCMWA